MKKKKKVNGNTKDYNKQKGNKMTGLYIFTQILTKNIAFIYI